MSKYNINQTITFSVGTNYVGSDVTEDFCISQFLTKEELSTLTDDEIEYAINKNLDEWIQDNISSSFEVA